MQEVLPRKNGRYLRGILGNVDCNILDKNEKYQYKEQYEQFKLIVMLIGKTKTKENRSFDLIHVFYNFASIGHFSTLNLVWRSLF